VDVVDADLGRSLARFMEAGGKLAQLTASSDASITGPHTLFSQLRSVVLEKLFSLEQVLPLVTSNPARILKLADRGAIHPGACADLILARRSDLRIEHVFCAGRRLVRDGRFVVQEKCMEQSNREVVLRGQQT
jgi:adenine deaminase